MRTFYGPALLLLAVTAGRLEAQGPPADRPGATVVPWGARPLPRELAPDLGPSSRAASPDSTRRRPFFLPREGEHTAYWVGFTAGLALSPLLWCEGSGCGAVSKASTSLLLGSVGAVGGLLLTRAF